MFFKYQTLYIGDSLVKFQTIRDILDLKGIKYKYSIIQHQRQRTRTIMPGTKENKLYEIKVPKDEFEQAEYYIHSKD